MNQLEQRIARIGGTVQQINERLNHLETRVDVGFSDLREEMRSLRREMKEHEERLREEMKGA